MPEINNNFQFRGQQEHAYNELIAFCQDPKAKVFILKGYAGTGKTTLMRQFFNWLNQNKYVHSDQANEADSPRYVPLASTGRAAKVLRDKAGQPATTIHSYIYNFDGFNQDLEQVTQQIKQNHGIDNTGQLLLFFKFEPVKEEFRKSVIYIIDEASMVGDTIEPNPLQARFGTGRLLHDLLTYNPEGKFVFVGDDCQLPPVHDSISPALSPEYITANFHLPAEAVRSVTLTRIIRQQEDNDLIVSAQRMRTLAARPPQVKWAKFPMRGYRNIKILANQLDLINLYVKEVKAHGYSSTTLITGSNSQCNKLAQILRPMLGLHDPTLQINDLLLVTQNSFSNSLINGDMVKVLSIGNRQRRAGLTFVQVEVEEVNTHQVKNTLLIEDIIYSGRTNLDHRQQKALFIDFYYREKERNIRQKDQKFKDDIMTDPYLNALRCVYGYAITCHKSQGGEWDKVFLDIPRYKSRHSTSDTYRWLYTAMTRASDTLYVVDDFFIEYSANILDIASVLPPHTPSNIYVQPTKI